MTEKRLLVVTTSPEENVDAILDAISKAGGGIVGNYSHCAFTTKGTGRFKPDDTAQPYSGQIGEIHQEAEVRIETFCPRSAGKTILQAIRSAHPYEEPVIYLLPLLDEDEL